MKQFIAILLFSAGVTGYGQGQPCVADSCCLGGTIWDEELGGCVVANVSDTDFDGCVGINDFLVHLSNFGSGCGPEPAWACGDPLEYQGYDYETVQIGGKCWFAEDLQTAHFTNDDPIAFAPDINYSVANSVDIPVYALAFDQYSEQNGEYGKLYNHPAVLDARGLCPSGWDVSSADNWEDLKGWVSINTWFPNANALKSEFDWSPPSNGLDLFGFNAKPSGHYTQGICYGGQQANSIGIWWTSTESDVSGQTYIMESDYDEITWYDGGCNPNVCFAVRCVKD